MRSWETANQDLHKVSSSIIVNALPWETWEIFEIKLISVLCSKVRDSSNISKSSIVWRKFSRIQHPTQIVKYIVMIYTEAHKEIIYTKTYKENRNCNDIVKLITKSEY